MVNGNNHHTGIVSSKAIEMLTDHSRFLANVSEEAARTFIEEYKLAARSLELFSERNPSLTDQALPINK